MQARDIHKRFFRKLYRYCFSGQKQIQSRVSHLVLLELRPNAICELTQPPWSKYIELLHNLEYRVKVNPLQEEIPSRYIGVQSFYNEEILKSRQYLLQQEVSVLEKTIAFEAIPSSALVASITVSDNIHNSYNKTK
jgi:hypothetical protein